MKINKGRAVWQQDAGSGRLAPQGLPRGGGGAGGGMLQASPGEAGSALLKNDFP